MDEASLERYVFSSSILHSNRKYYLKRSSTFIVYSLFWTHSRRIAFLWRYFIESIVEKYFEIAENFKHNLYRDKILQQLSMGGRKNSTKKNICAAIFGIGETIREVDGDGITTSLDKIVDNKHVCETAEHNREACNLLWNPRDRIFFETGI